MKSKFKILGIILVLAALAAAALVWRNFSKRQPKGNDKQEQQAALTGQTPLFLSQVDKKLLPELFPANLPVEKGAEVVENYDASESTTGQQQSTRVYVTKKSLAENMAIYKKFLSENKWSSFSAADGDDEKILMGNKEKDSITILVRHNAANNRNTVSISVTRSK